MDLEKIWETVRTWLLTTGIKLPIALILLIVSFRIIKVVGKKIEAKESKRLEANKRIDKTLYRTVGNVITVGLKILIVVALFGYLGLDTGGITALITSLGVGVGFAVNGTLSNLAGGVLLLITRPFKDDDYISACGYEGTVTDILICNTKIRTNDNKIIYLPNGKLSTSEIVNYTEKPTRRVDVTFSIAYSDDFEQAESVMQQVFADMPLVLKDPVPNVRVSAHSASSIDLTAMVWCKTEDYWSVRFDLLEKVKLAFDKENISIPFDQLDVHLKND